MPDPWEKLPEETDKAYKAFLTFLRLGEGRTIAAAAATRKTRDGKAPVADGRVPGHWGHWCATNRWYERAAAWDDCQTRRQVDEMNRRAQEDAEAEADEVVEWRKQHARDLWATYDLAARRVKRVIRRDHDDAPASHGEVMEAIEEYNAVVNHAGRAIAIRSPALPPGAQGADDVRAESAPVLDIEEAEAVWAALAEHRRRKIAGYGEGRANGFLEDMRGR